MILGFQFDGLGKFLTVVVRGKRTPVVEQQGCTNIASSNFFSANALLPSALSASAILRACISFNFIDQSYLLQKSCETKKVVRMG